MGLKSLVITETTWRQIIDAAKALRGGLSEDGLRASVRAKLNMRRGVSRAQAEALYNIISHIGVWTTPTAQQLLAQFQAVWLDGEPEPVELVAEYNQGEDVVRPDTSFEAINRKLDVYARLRDNSMTPVLKADRTIVGQLTEGLCHMSVLWGGLSAGFNVQVLPYPVAVSIGATYYMGQEEILPGTPVDSLRPHLRVHRNNSDGTRELVQGYTLTGTLAPGFCEIGVSYEGFTTAITVPVLVSVERIEADYTQSAVIYPDTPLTEILAELIVTAYYNDGSALTVSTEDCVLSGELTIGTSQITVSYSGFSATIAVVVTPHPEITRIEAVYTQGAVVYPDTPLTALLAGLSVTAYYSDGSTFTVSPEDCTLSGVLEIGTSQITVSYSGVSATIDVTVMPYPEAAHIEAQIVQDAVIYDTSSLDRLRPMLSVVQVMPSGATQAVPIADCLLDGELTPGVSEITVSYDGMTDSVSVTVTEETLPGEYQRVSYIGSSNTGNGPYLMVPVVFPQNYTVKFRARKAALGLAACPVILAHKVNESNYQSRGEIGYSATGKVYCWSGASATTDVIPDLYGDFVAFEAGFSASAPYTTIKVQTDSDTYTAEQSATAKHTDMDTALVFARSYNPFPGEVDEIMFESSGSVFADLVPCYRRADGIIGMFDMIAGVFHTNGGTGTFTKGEDL